MFGFIKRMLTEKDNVTQCPVRMGVVGTGVMYHVGAAWMVMGQHAALDMTLLGQYIHHMSELALASATAIGAKSVMKADAPSEPTS
jgi:biotin transporter BioY